MKWTKPALSVFAFAVVAIMAWKAAATQIFDFNDASSEERTRQPSAANFGPGQTLLIATTSEYPGEYSEFMVHTDQKNRLRGLSITEHEKDKDNKDQRFFSVDELNSEDGVVLKEALTVDLLILKGKNISDAGGGFELRYRSSNWSSDYGTFPLRLVRKPNGSWVALTKGDRNQLAPLRALHIEVWSGFGFGIEAIKPVFL